MDAVTEHRIVQVGVNGYGATASLSANTRVPGAIPSAPALTSVHIPLEEVGYQAVRAAIDSEWTPAPLRMEVHLRASTPPVS